MPASLARHRLPRLAAALGAVAALSACSALGLGGDASGQQAFGCPEVRLDRATADLVQFEGSGRDITDMRYAVTVEGFGGDCAYEDEAVTVTLIPVFSVERGPAAPEGAAEGSFEYFVALPRYFPDPAGKEVFPVRFRFPDPVTPRMRLRDEPVTLTLPRDPGEDLGGEVIYLGLQLTPAQLDYNRQRQRRR